MEEVIIKILEESLLKIGEIVNLKKINIGFTNELYLLDDKYILKICIKETNEENFLREINFYLENKDNKYIPKLIAYNINKKKIPYLYEIIEKIEGGSLYNVWHTLNEKERRDVIRKITDVMKDIHSHKKPSFNWINYIREELLYGLKRLEKINYFDEREKEMLNKVIEKLPKYLVSSDFVLIHNDLHFDNIFYNDGNIKIIDFERSMIAPRDYELDILLRMVKKSEKFASEETEEYTNNKDYVNIPNYLEEFYPEVFKVPYLKKRLAIYDILYYLNSSYEYPKLRELKDNIIEAISIVLDKED